VQLFQFQFEMFFLILYIRPDTQAYLQKIEREKQEKAQGDQGDNRSFIAKYVNLLGLF